MTSDNSATRQLSHQAAQSRIQPQFNKITSHLIQKLLSPVQTQVVAITATIIATLIRRKSTAIFLLHLQPTSLHNSNNSLYKCTVKCKTNCTQHFSEADVDVCRSIDFCWQTVAPIYQPIAFDFRVRKMMLKINGTYL